MKLQNRRAFWLAFWITLVVTLGAFAALTAGAQSAATGFAPASGGLAAPVRTALGHLEGLADAAAPLRWLVPAPVRLGAALWRIWQTAPPTQPLPGGLV